MRLYAMNADFLSAPDVFCGCYQQLSVYRQRRVDAFRLHKDKALSLGAGVLLQVALDAYGLRERDMVYGSLHNKKPIFENEPDIHFNISHSGEMVILAVGEVEVGCDIQQQRHVDLAIAQRFFTQDEYRYIMSYDGMQARCNAFFELWTLKESFMKLTGLGMKLPLNAFSINIEHENISVHYSPMWDATQFVKNTVDNYNIAVCAHKLNSIKITKVDYKDVINSLKL